MGPIIFAQPQKKNKKEKNEKKSGGVAQYCFGKKLLNPKKQLKLLNVHFIYIIFEQNLKYIHLNNEK
jgi:hypothetical protein